MYCKIVFLVTDISLTSDNPLSFRGNLLERIQQLIMTIGEKIRDKKLQYDIHREAANLSALPSGKIDKYEYLTGKEILPSDQSRKIVQAKSTYYSLRKAFEKQRKQLKTKGKTKKAIEQHEKQLVESNTLIIKYDYETEKDSSTILKQK